MSKYSYLTTKTGQRLKALNAFRQTKIKASAQITLTNVFDGEDGAGAESYDGIFDNGYDDWSSSYNSHIEPIGTKSIELASNDKKYGQKALEVSGNKWFFSKNHITINKDAVYKFTYRIRQTFDSTDINKNNVYAGASLFNMSKELTHINKGSYFITSGHNISTSLGWIEYTAYMSTSEKPSVSNSTETIPTVRAFEGGEDVTTIKPMFLVNYNGGNGIVEVDALLMEDITAKYNLIRLGAIDKEISDVDKSIIDLEDNMNNAFKDSILTEVEKESLRQNLITLSIEKEDVIAQVTAIKSNKLLEGTTELASLINQEKLFVNSHTDLVNKINQILNGATIDINIYFEQYKNALKALRHSMNTCSEKINKETVDNVEVTARNLILKTKSSQDIICNNEANKTGAFYDISIDIDEELKGKKVTFAYDWEYEGDRFGGTLIAQTAGPLYVSMSDRISINAERGVSKKTFVFPTGGETATKICIRADNIIGTITISKMRLFYGDKDVGWIAAPEDKTDADNIIGDVNGSIETDAEGNTLKISAKKINITGEVSFSSLNKNPDEFGGMFEKDNNKTIIDGGYIKTKSIQSDAINVYKLTVSKRRNNGTAENPDWVELTDEAPTFMVAEDGNISASGTFKSFNFKEDPNNSANNQGWMIDKDGNSIFNNTIVRGKVELPNAGVTNEGTTNTSVRFWAGENYQNRDRAPFKVLQDGTIISKRGEFGGTFTGELAIGNIRISDKVGDMANPSWGVIEIKNDNNAETVVKIGEQSSCFNSPTFFGPETMSTDISTPTVKISPKEKLLKVQCIPLISSSYDTTIHAETKTTILGPSINLNNKYKIETNATNKMYIKGMETESELIIQNESLNSQFNLSVHGYGNFKEGVVIGGIKVQPAPNNNGLDFFAAT